MTNLFYRSKVNEVRQRFGMTKITNSSVIIPSLAIPEFLREVEAIGEIGG